MRGGERPCLRAGLPGDKLTSVRGERKTPVKILVLDVSDAAQLMLLNRDKKWSFVSILTRRERAAYPAIEKCLENQDCVRLYFDDAAVAVKDYILPTEGDMLTVLEWARSRSNIVVHCFAGISRSSSTAMGIAFMKGGMELVRSTVSIPDKHWPNKLVLSLMDRILGSNLSGYVDGLCDF